MTFVSYAQNFEDVILHRALRHVSKGFYVDVGAQHPTIDSVTKAFSLSGWRGINIEPVAHWFNMLVDDRPYDINLNVAVSEREDDLLELFEVEGTGLSTTDMVFATRHREEGFTILHRQVPTLTLDRIFAEHQVSEVHFLKVDCEGAEKAALASCAFKSVRPWVVLVEATEPRSQVTVHEQWQHLLTERGYKCVYADGLNLFYVAEEHQELISAFSKPPNVFDDFVLDREKRIADTLEKTHAAYLAGQSELEQAKAVAGQLVSSLHEVTEHFTEWREWRERIEADSIALEARLALAEANEQGALSRATLAENALNKMRADEAKVMLRTQLASADEIDALRRRGFEMDSQLRHLASHSQHQGAVINEILKSSSWRLTAPLRGAKIVLRGSLSNGWRLARPIVARTARFLRPALRALLKAPGARPLARSILGPHTRLGRRARVFLFGATIVGPSGEYAGSTVMTEEAIAVDARLRAAIARQART